MKMELDVQTLMMIFFILFLVMSIWKIYAFLPNKELADDDTTEASQEELIELMLIVIKQNNGELSSLELFKQMKSHSSFDAKHFWRFNQNRLNQLLSHYYLENPDTQSIEDIYRTL
jgi:hypothetical protein